MSDCPHKPTPDLPYRTWHENAERRAAQGEEQRQCPVCKRWVWGTLWNDKEIDDADV